MSTSSGMSSSDVLHMRRFLRSVSLTVSNCFALRTKASAIFIASHSVASIISCSRALCVCAIASICRCCCSICWRICSVVIDMATGSGERVYQGWRPFGRGYVAGDVRVTFRWFSCSGDPSAGHRERAQAAHPPSHLRRRQFWLRPPTQPRLVRVPTVQKHYPLPLMGPCRDGESSSRQQPGVFRDVSDPAAPRAVPRGKIPPGAAAPSRQHRPLVGSPESSPTAGAALCWRLLARHGL